MNKRKILPIILITVIVVSFTLCGTVLAYMFRQTEYKENQFIPAVVSCVVVETFDGQQKSSVQVQNTGNIGAYLRVRLVSYWVCSEGNIAAKPSSMPENTLAEGWIKGSNNTYYYQDVVAPTELTDNLLASPIILQKDENGYMQVIEVFAEAIQSEPLQAVTDSWGVSVDSNGHIIAP